MAIIEILESKAEHITLTCDVTTVYIRAGYVLGMLEMAKIAGLLDVPRYNIWVHRITTMRDKRIAEIRCKEEED